MHDRLLGAGRPRAARRLARLAVLSSLGLLLAVAWLPGRAAGETTGGRDGTLDRARVMLEKGDAAGAEKLLLEADAATPNDPAILAAIAETLHEQERTKEAVRYYERVVDLDPANVDARLRLADFYLWTDQQDSALEHYLVVQETRPNDPSLHQKMAQILMAMDRTEEAIPHLESYLMVVPGDVEAMKVLYKAYLWTDRPDRALDVLRHIVEKEPDNVEMARELAERYVDNDNITEAVGIYEKILESRPDDAESLRSVGQLYEWTDRPKVALAAYEKYLKIKPFDSDVRARALSLSMDLGYSRRSKRHAGILGESDPRYDSLARKALLVDPGVGSAIGTEYLWFGSNQGFNHHAWRLWGSVGISEEVTLGAFYRFHWFTGAYSYANPNDPKQTVYGHQPGLFGTFKLPDQWVLSWNMSVVKYHGFTSWTSLVNTRLEVSRDFDFMSLTMYAERADNHRWVGAIADKVVLNTAGLELYFVPVEKFFISLNGEYSWLNSAANLNENHRLFGEASVGYIIFDLPLFEATYSYSIEHFLDQGTAATNYFAPAHYQTHGPGLVFRHPVNTWFLYGLDLHLMHVINDSSLLLTYGANIGFHPGESHHFTVSYLRTDTIYGTTSTVFSENVLRAAYTYEF